METREQRSATTEQGQRRNLDRPARPEPLPYPVVDSHCHLDVADGKTDLAPADAIAAAAAVGVTRIVQVGCDVAGSQWAVRAAERFRRRARAGMVMINAPTAGIEYHAGFGGRRPSGFGGRELGGAAAEFFTEGKTTYINHGVI